MSGFVRGVLVGVGIGLLVAPMRGEELRGILSGRLQELRENDQVNQYVQQARETLGGLAEVTVGKVMKENGGTLTEMAQLAVNRLSESGFTLSDLLRVAVSIAKLIS